MGNIINNPFKGEKKEHLCDINLRLKILQKLKEIIQTYEELILGSIKKDLNRNYIDSYNSEIFYVIKEINFFLKNLKKLSKPKKVRTSLINFPAKSYYLFEPFGTVLVISPWNYPFGLSLMPSVGAIAAGNSVILKPSEISKNSSETIAKLINDNFEESIIRVIQGGAEVTQDIINNGNINFIFFTGSAKTGRIIMNYASQKLIPLVLELGGKNPCIIDNINNLEIAAKRVIFGKFFNAGQTCVAPDYLIVKNDVYNDFIDFLIKTIEEFYLKNNDIYNFPKIINEFHFNRLIGLLDNEKILCGGKYNNEKLIIEPTIIEIGDLNSKIMEEEIFGPIIPVLRYQDEDNLFEIIHNYPQPLVIYCFTNDKTLKQKILNYTSSGSVCFNGTIHILFGNKLPFGGVGNSGFGKYHGIFSFETFSNKRAILDKTIKFDFKQMYPPYKNSLNFIKKISKVIYYRSWK